VTRSSLRVLAAGSARAENVRVLVQALAELRKLDSHIEGIVGQNFLLRFNYLLDYRKHSLRFEVAHEIRDAIEGTRVPIEVSENKMMVISEAQSIGHAKLLLQLDSGASSVVLIRKTSRALKLPIEDAGQESTSSGQVGFLVGHLQSLTIGSQQFHDIVVAMPATPSDDADRIEDGLLPTFLFQSIYVNNRETFVVFNSRNKMN